LTRVSLVIISLVLLSGCVTVATESEDGKTLTIEGLSAGSAEFQSGSKIKKEPFFKLFDGPIKIEQ